MKALPLFPPAKGSPAVRSSLGLVLGFSNSRRPSIDDWQCRRKGTAVLQVVEMSTAEQSRLDRRAVASFLNVSDGSPYLLAKHVNLVCHVLGAGGELNQLVGHFGQIEGAQILDFG
jgi:hypothetical protein